MKKTRSDIKVRADHGSASARGAKAGLGPPRSLRALDPSALSIGATLPGSILSADGRVLLRAGRILEQADLKGLERRGGEGVFGDDDWPEACWLDSAQPTRKAKGKPANHKGNVASPRPASRPAHKPRNKKGMILVSVDSLQPGSRLDAGLYTSRGALLLPEGVEVTYRLLSKLRRYRIFEVHLGDPNACGVDDGAEPDTKKRTGIKTTRRGRRRSTRARLRLADLRAETERAQEVYRGSVGRVGNMLVDAFHGRRSSPAALEQVVAQFVEFTQLDACLLPSVINSEGSPREYLYQHGLNVSLLAVNMAADMGLTEEQTVEVGLGALMQDLGMLCIPDALRMAPRALTDDELLEIKRHPIYSVDRLERIGVPDTSLMIAYQSHERPDRSGYPRGRHGMFIHPYARLVAVGDAYAALSAPRPYRERMIPYKAMLTLIQEGQRDHFDRNVIRTYLDCLSLFPIGSRVELSNGHVAKVVRANPGLHTKPVVVVLEPDGSESDFELDLACADSIRVVKALPNEHVEQKQTACSTSP